MLPRMRRIASDHGRSGAGSRRRRRRRDPTAHHRQSRARRLRCRHRRRRPGRAREGQGGTSVRRDARRDDAAPRRLGDRVAVARGPGDRGHQGDPPVRPRAGGRPATRRAHRRRCLSHQAVRPRRADRARPSVDDRSRGKARVKRITLAAAFLAALTACGGGTSTTTGGPSPTPTSTPTTYRSPPATLPVTGVDLSTAPPPWLPPALLNSGKDSAAYVAAAGLPYAEEMLSVHYHAHLDIIANGEKVEVPPYVGFVTVGTKALGLAPLHTHQSDGIIHIE